MSKAAALLARHYGRNTEDVYFRFWDECRKEAVDVSQSVVPRQTVMLMPDKSAVIFQNGTFEVRECADEY